jgi:hypothetical protein
MTMTAITLNLLAEEQLAQEARARDPVKLFIAVGLGVLAIVVALGGVLSAVLMQKRSDLAGLQSKWDKMNNGGAEESSFQKLNNSAGEIVAINHSRVLIAPQLALVKDLIPSSVELTQLAFAMSVESPGSDGGGDDGQGQHGGHPKKSQRLVVRLDGKAFGGQPELEVDRFLKLLRSDARFSALVEDIQLRSIARMAETDKSGVTRDAANFSIECWYKEKTMK